jgi:hypothetical protein
MAAMRCHVQADFVYMDAPNEATGAPDDGVQMYYPNLSYFEWSGIFPHRLPSNLWNRNSSGQKTKRNLFDAAEAVLRVIDSKGPFDGILGFSQVFICLLEAESQTRSLMNRVGSLYGNSHRPLEASSTAERFAAPQICDIDQWHPS